MCFSDLTRSFEVGSHHAELLGHEDITDPGSFLLSTSCPAPPLAWLLVT